MRAGQGSAGSVGSSSATAMGKIHVLKTSPGFSGGLTR